MNLLIGLVSALLIAIVFTAGLITGIAVSPETVTKTLKRTKLLDRMTSLKWKTTLKFRAILKWPAIRKQRAASITTTMCSIWAQTLQSMETTFTAQEQYFHPNPVAVRSWLKTSIINMASLSGPVSLLRMCRCQPGILVFSFDASQRLKWPLQVDISQSLLMHGGVLMASSTTMFLSCSQMQRLTPLTLRSISDQVLT